MAASPYVRSLRARIGHDLLLLPSVTVLAQDGDGRVLLVRQADSGRWGTVGGAVDPDESPAEAAVREAEEEAGVEVELGPVLGVLGGPDFRMRYPNGDEAAYVSIVFDGHVTAGTPRPDGDETIEVAWVARTELAALDLTPFARASFSHLGWI